MRGVLRRGVVTARVLRRNFGKTQYYRGFIREGSQAVSPALPVPSEVPRPEYVTNPDYQYTSPASHGPAKVYSQEQVEGIHRAAQIAGHALSEAVAAV